MMRKTTGMFAVLLLAVLMLWLLPVLAAADVEDRSRVDAVIIVDVSSSMNYNGAEEDSKQNTPLYDAAYDAATMFIHMCEMNGSRVAVVPFSDEVFENTPNTGDYAWCTLRDVSDVAVRDEMIKKIRALRTDNATNLGAAMEKAYEIIRDSREDESANQPMILLLTDGAVEIFENGKRQNEASDASAAQAVEFARKSREELGCKLYCVGLKGKTFNGDSLYAYTDSDMIHVAENSDQLPSFFNDVFAKQIGAQILGESHITKTQNEDGTVTLSIRIPNNSILEANVILNCNESTDAPSVWDGDGRDVTHDGGVYLFRGKSYCIVKIENPAAGNYQITYLPGTQEDINVSLITNYKVQYQIEAGTTFAKNTPFTVSTYFTENGAHSSDDALYTSNDMHAWVSLYDEAGSWLGDYDMEAVSEPGNSRFDCTLPALKTGHYQLISNVEGEGLERTSSVFWIEMFNQAPVLSGGIYDPIELKINDILTSDDPHKPVTDTIALSDYFADADAGDSLNYDYTLEGSSVQASVEGDSLLLTTTGTEGETTVTVWALDEDGASSGLLTFKVKVQDVQAAIRNGQSLVMKTTTNDPQLKGSDVRVLIGLQDQSGKWISSPEINRYLAENQSFYWQSDAAQNVTQQVLTLSFDETVGCLSGTVPTEYKAGWYTVGGSIVGQEDFMTLPEDTGFEVGNAAPEAPEAEKNEEMRIEPLPMDLTFGLEALGSRETAQLALSDIFTDGDNEPLVYTVKDAQGNVINQSQNEGTLYDESGEAVAEWQINEESLTLTANRAGTAEMVLTAQDGDGETAEMQLHISVVSIRAGAISRVLKILALALAAILFVRILYVALLKPSYPKKCEIQVKVNSTHRTQKSVGGKRKYKLSAIVDSACSRDAGLERADLAKITIQPAMGGVILVKNKTKRKDRIEINVANRTVQPSKKERLPLGGEIRIAKSGSEGEGYVTLVYRKKV